MCNRSIDFGQGILTIVKRKVVKTATEIVELLVEADSV